MYKFWAGGSSSALRFPWCFLCTKIMVCQRFCLAVLVHWSMCHRPPLSMAPLACSEVQMK